MNFIKKLLENQTEKQRVGRSSLYGYRKAIADECRIWCNRTVPNLSRSGIENIQAYCLSCGHYWHN